MAYKTLKQIDEEENQSGFISWYLQFNAQTYLFHWQTESYARHIAYDTVNADMTALVDGFVESYQGKYGRMYTGGTSISVTDLDTVGEETFIKRYIHYLLTGAVEMLDEQRDSDLRNILDEMVARLNKLLYLLTLK